MYWQIQCNCTVQACPSTGKSSVIVPVHAFTGTGKFSVIVPAVQACTSTGKSRVILQVHAFTGTGDWRELEGIGGKNWRKNGRIEVRRVQNVGKKGQRMKGGNKKFKMISEGVEDWKENGKEGRRRKKEGMQVV